jgi:hypothetical protein
LQPTACAAAKIDYALGAWMINASDKIDSRTKSLIFEAQILNGVPLWFDSAPPLAAVGL